MRRCSESSFTAPRHTRSSSTKQGIEYDLPDRVARVSRSTAWCSTPISQRPSSTEIQPVLQQKLGSVAGSKIAVFQLPSLPGARGLPVQFAIKTTEPALRLNEVSRAFLDEAQKSGMFMFFDTDLKYDLPQSVIEIDRDKAAQLGLTMSSGRRLAREPARRRLRQLLQHADALVQSHSAGRAGLAARTSTSCSTIRSPTSAAFPVPLSTDRAHPHRDRARDLNHFQQLNSATLSGVASPGVSQADALNYLRDLAARTLAFRIHASTTAVQSRQFVQESTGVMGTFGFAIIIAFLTLAALYESFRDPLVILISVPLSIAGALIFIALGVHGASLNIYTQVGLVTLIGLISKHGILIVEVANEEQQSGKSKRDAIVAAAGMRLRPILMTTAAMVLGVVPLVFARGAGGASRYAIGLVISTGLGIGTLFTLFVVPAVYVMIGATHSDSRRVRPSRRRDAESTGPFGRRIPSYYSNFTLFC